MKKLLFIFVALLAGCAGFPKDPEGTLERIRSARQFRVGIIASGAVRMDPGRERAFLANVASAARAEPILVQGAAEPLLEDLEHGRVDLVVGELAADSPWATRVTILPPISVNHVGDRLTEVSAMARNGENAWIMLLERAGRRTTAKLR